MTKIEETTCCVISLALSLTVLILGFLWVRHEVIEYKDKIVKSPYIWREGMRGIVLPLWYGVNWKKTIRNEKDME